MVVSADENCWNVSPRCNTPGAVRAAMQTWHVPVESVSGTKWNMVRQGFIGADPKRLAAEVLMATETDRQTMEPLAIAVANGGRKPALQLGITVPHYFKNSSFWVNDQLNVTALSIWGNFLIFINNLNFGDVTIKDLYEQRWQTTSLWEVDWEAKAAAQTNPAAKIPFELKAKLKAKLPIDEQLVACFVLSFKTFTNTLEDFQTLCRTERLALASLVPYMLLHAAKCRQDTVLPRQIFAGLGDSTRPKEEAYPRCLPFIPLIRSQCGDVDWANNIYTSQKAAPEPTLLEAQAKYASISSSLN